MLSRASRYLITAIALAGCQPQQPPAPLPSPTSLFKSDYFSGSALTGPVAAPLPSSAPGDAYHLTVRFIALEKIPTTSYAPLASRAVFVSSSSAGNAISPAAELTQSATITDLKSPNDLNIDLQHANAGRTATMHEFTAALPAGVTACFTAVDTAQVLDLVTGKPTSRNLRVLITRPGNPANPPQLALSLKDLIHRKNDKLDLITEQAICNLPDGPTSTTALIVPFHFDQAASTAVVVLIQISPGSNDPDHVAATADCLAQLTDHQSSTQPVLATGEASNWSTVTAAVQSLTPPGNRRSSLAFLSNQTGATLCEDLAMEADDGVLNQLVSNIQAKVAAHALPPNDPTVGWLLDHTALELLARLAGDSANNTPMPAELSAVLTTHTGEVARHPSTLDDVLRGVSTRQDLDNRLLAQNLIFLEDSSPASRVRAFDWLNARHHAPAGYDPLGPARARRDALEKAAESSARN